MPVPIEQGLPYGTNAAPSHPYLKPLPCPRSVCLYLQNQDFLRQAEALSGALHGAALGALGSLAHIQGNLTAQQQVGASVEG